jgi:hypothetical protein
MLTVQIGGEPGGYDPLADGLKGRCLTTLLYARGPFDPVYDRRPSLDPLLVVHSGFDPLSVAYRVTALLLS